jgi:hypothetical protein
MIFHIAQPSARQQRHYNFLENKGSTKTHKLIVGDVYTVVDLWVAQKDVLCGHLHV